SPVTIFTPLYLQKVLRVEPFTVGLLLLALPISTIVAGPIGGRLADRYNPRVIAALGAFVTFLAIFFYSRLGIATPVVLVLLPLALTREQAQEKRTRSRYTKLHYAHVAQPPTTGPRPPTIDHRPSTIDHSSHLVGYRHLVLHRDLPVFGRGAGDCKDDLESRL